VEEFFHWIKRLQESPEFHGRIKKICAWNTDKLATLQRLDYPVMRAVDLWVTTTIEGYTIKFAAENCQSLS
jgi:hypothetical protein